ncbi:MAG TPA: serine/threonine-protein phosphatase, partial [Propionibacteriaceae bacterium]|nr:serine/threonine-protein phosphatase [Propionibacteriaceae bacterium]
RPLVGLLILLIVAGAGLASAYAWARSQFYVGVAGEKVAIYQGLADTLPAVPLSRVYEIQPLALADLPPYYQEQVRGNIEVPSLESARVTVAELTKEAERCATRQPTPTPVPTPKPTTSPVATAPAGTPTTRPSTSAPPPTPTTTPSPSGGPVAPEC